jgi:hypothetical protein
MYIIKMLSTFKISEKNYIELGKDIIKDNPFYFTLHLLLKYYFLQQPDIYIMNFLKDITNTKEEFKVFMIYLEFAKNIYNIEYKENYTYMNDDMIYTLIYYVKTRYDNDRSVLQPFITSAIENEYNIVNNFNTVKSMYNFKKDALEKFDRLNMALSYLDKARELEEEAKKYSKMAFDILQNLKGEFVKTIYDENLFIKNV